VDSWSKVTVPALPPLDVVVRLGDGAALPREVSLYVCGITPYDATHLGHAKTYLTFDHLVRVLRASGHALRYVQNVTDVDDPLLERAAELGVDWRDLAREGIALYFADMEALRVIPPDHYVGVVESIPLVVDAVTRLLDGGAAYPLAGGDGGGADVYAGVASDRIFWDTLPVAPAEAVAVFAERGGDPARPGKHNPLDPLLWLAERTGEPAWDGATLGPGRPGWHVECAVIAAEYLGGHPTITGGGTDLAFPHHPMSASHLRQLGYAGECHTVHVGMVGLDGHKMSKSLGNLVFVSRLRAGGADPRAIRLALAAHHHTTDWEWHDSQLSAAEIRLARWREAARAAAGTDKRGVDDSLAAALARDLAANLDTPAALATVDGWVDRVLAGDVAARADAHALDAVDALLGIDLRS
jgi:L-cysteine:1D-myo-inositol 2-amino-2-deoxy-alpha-D-glucopyranoside ligase